MNIAVLIAIRWDDKVIWYFESWIPTAKQLSCMLVKCQVGVCHLCVSLELKVWACWSGECRPFYWSSVMGLLVAVGFSTVNSQKINWVNLTLLPHDSESASQSYPNTVKSPGLVQGQCCQYWELVGNSMWFQILSTSFPPPSITFLLHASVRVFVCGVQGNTIWL